jgi:hypothetical protein
MTLFQSHQNIFPSNSFHKDFFKNLSFVKKEKLSSRCEAVIPKLEFHNNPKVSLIALLPLPLFQIITTNSLLKIISVLLNRHFS